MSYATANTDALPAYEGFDSYLSIPKNIVPYALMLILVFGCVTADVAKEDRCSNQNTYGYGQGDFGCGDFGHGDFNTGLCCN
jgi:hypothetical protein